jgi:branched-chain amino acid transport system substrate-binding protein
MMKKRIRFAIPLILCLVLVVTALAAVACGGKDGKTGVTIPGKDTIVIGQVRSLTGPYAFYEANAFGPARELWLEEVNADGGIFIKDYGKKMKVEMKIYDDGTNLDMMTQLYEKLMTEDKVDFIFGPNSTAYTFAAAGVANQYGYLLMSCEGGDRTLETQLKDLPLFFGVLNYSTTEVPALIEIFKEKGIKTVAIAYNDDLHGIEYSEAMVEEAGKAGIQVVYNEPFPYETADFSNIIRKVQELNPDCFYFPGYPEHNFPMVPQLIQSGYNPKMLVLGPGGTFGAFPYAMGGANGPEYGYQVVNGVSAYGAWSIHSSAALSDLRDKLLNSPALKAKGFTEANMDYWGHAFYYAELQLFQQALEKAGSLDNAKVAQLLKTEHFQTVLGDTWFDNQILATECHPGQMGQWQNGVFEVIDVGTKRTAAPIYPKPAWPAAPAAPPAATPTTVAP